MLPQHVLDREIERLVELGVTIKTNVEVGKDVTWDDLKRNYDACVLAVGLIEPNSARAEGEDKEGVLFGLPFLRDIGMGTSKVKLGARVAVIGGGNTAIDCAREALRQGAVEVTMITVESNPQEMPAVPEDLHDMLEEGVELLHGRAMTAVLGNGKVEALQLHPARFSGAINASPITIDREAPARALRRRQRDHRRGTASVARLGCRTSSRPNAALSRSTGSDVSATRTFLPPATSCSSVRVSR